MDEKMNFNRRVAAAVALCFWFQTSSLCWCLNHEGLALLKLKDRVVSDPFDALGDWNDVDGQIDPCSWFGVECSHGKVVLLNLNNLCLRGTLASELGVLIHLKSIILRNNSFYGIIPEEIRELEELEVLDLGYNNFSGTLPLKLGSNLSRSILLLDNNELLDSLSPEIHKLNLLSEIQVDQVQKLFSCSIRPNTRKSDQTEDARYRRLLNVGTPAEATSTGGPETSPFPSSSAFPPKSSPPLMSEPPISSPNFTFPEKSSDNQTAILAGIIGGSLFIFAIIIGIYYLRCNKATIMNPSTAGLSGQLKKAFVIGVPKLKRSELETACEDFSNVVGSSSIGSVYKGTLSSGVEIAVISISVNSAIEWSKHLEEQFQKKVDKLSKMNHKNFVNLLGYCEEDEPFTRMMVFEYAPNGTLFEHLHIKESEHLDWEMRLRIAMGMAYFLEHIHQLTPPIFHKNLNSSTVNLTEDYAAKVSEFNFWIELAGSDIEHATIELSHTASGGPKCNIYNFGVVLFEMVTGRLPYSSLKNSSIDDWASHYLRRELSLKEMVDPTLEYFDEHQLDEIGEVINLCVQPDPYQRPSMSEVAARLRDITGVAPSEAIPKISPLWWAELEILSTEAA